MRHPCAVSEMPMRTGPDGTEPPRRRATRLGHYVDRDAARSRGVTAAAIGALFALATRPEVGCLAGAMPKFAALPLDVVGSTLEQLVLTDGRRAMQYGS